ncbi:MAG: CBS domain-containing protein [Candidatus Binataceae bacterium]
MPIDDDEAERAHAEELEGPSDLQSALLKDTLTDVVSRSALTLDENSTLAEVIGLMRREHRGCALLTRDGRLSGIFTERDLLLRVAGLPVDYEHTAVSVYMTRDPVTLPADSNVAFALNRMTVEGFRHIPLVDDAGHPTGVVSMREVVQYLSDFFSKDVLNLPPDPRIRFKSREGA